MQFWEVEQKQRLEKAFPRWICPHTYSLMPPWELLQAILLEDEKTLGPDMAVILDGNQSTQDLYIIPARWIAPPNPAEISDHGRMKSINSYYIKTLRFEVIWYTILSWQQVINKLFNRSKTGLWIIIAFLVGWGKNKFCEYLFINTDIFQLN